MAKNLVLTHYTQKGNNWSFGPIALIMAKTLAILSAIWLTQVYPFLQVPVGTIVKDLEGKILTSLEKESDFYIAARGGSGGKGNHSFTTSLDTAPKYAEKGAAGEDRELNVELRTMAHAGLVSALRINP